MKSLIRHQYDLAPTLCKKCLNPIIFEKRLTNQFCSKSCSASFVQMGKTHSEETKQKIKHTVQSHRSDLFLVDGNLGRLKICQYKDCGKEFFSRRKKTSCCSRSCAMKNRATPSFREHLSALGKKNIVRQAAQGKWKGWSGRSEPSFPEKYIMGLLEEDGYKKDIDYKFNFPLEGFFVDFAFENIKIAFEVDGKQHAYEENLERDLRKDKALCLVGWQVLRLPWYSVKKQTEKEKVISRYKEIIQIIKSLE